MNLALACLSQGGYEPQFGETKASISKAPYEGFSVHAHCTQCALLISSLSALIPLVTSSFFILCPWRVWTVMLRYQFSCWPINLQLETLHDVIAEKSRLAVVLVVSWNHYVPSYVTTKPGFVCFPRALWLSCHLATPEKSQERMWSLRVICALFLSFVLQDVSY